MAASLAYAFSNGILIYRDDLIDVQIARYSERDNPNLHEPVEENWIIEVFRHNLLENPIFIDIGAAVGYYSILIKRTWPDARIFAVEALPRHCSRIAPNFELNGLPISDLTLVPFAVGAQAGEAQFIDSGYGSKLHRTGDTLWGERLTVEKRTLSTIVSDVSPTETIHMMKMDVQGEEADILYSASELLSAGRIRHVIVGTHGDEIHQRVVDILNATGFQILCDDKAPPMQPDGLIVASHHGSKPS